MSDYLSQQAFEGRQRAEIASLRQRAETAERERNIETQAVALEIAVRDCMVTSLRRLADPLVNGNAAEWTEAAVRVIEQRLAALEAVAEAARLYLEALKWCPLPYSPWPHTYQREMVAALAALQSAAQAGERKGVER